MRQVKARQLLVYLVLLTCYGAGAQSAVRHYKQACSWARLKASARVGRAVFNTYASDVSEDTCLQVISDGKVVFRRTDNFRGEFTLGQKADAEIDSPTIPNGTDITGRGVPDMIVSAWTSGVHCCLTQYVFELKPKFKLLATIRAKDAGTSHFADLDRNGHFYDLTEDRTFFNWPGSFAGSPHVAIILAYSGAGGKPGFHLDLAKMRKPAPTLMEWTEQSVAARNLFRHEDRWEEPFDGDFWQILLNLIYSGNSKYAWRLLGESWPTQVTSKTNSTIEFCSLLKSSPYFRDLDKPLDGAPRECVLSKPAQQN